MCKVLFAEQIIKFIPNLRIPAKSKKSICKSISRSVHQFLANPQIQQKEPQSQRGKPQSTNKKSTKKKTRTLIVPTVGPKPYRHRRNQRAGVVGCWNSHAATVLFLHHCRPSPWTRVPLPYAAYMNLPFGAAISSPESRSMQEKIRKARGEEELRERGSVERKRTDKQESCIVNVDTWRSGS